MTIYRYYISESSLEFETIECEFNGATFYTKRNGFIEHIIGEHEVNSNEEANIYYYPLLKGFFFSEKQDIKYIKRIYIEKINRDMLNLKTNYEIEINKLELQLKCIVNT